MIVHGEHGRALAERSQMVRRAVEGMALVVATSSPTALVMHARSAGGGACVFVDLGGNDAMALDRPGERLLRRLGGNPAIRPRLVACADAATAPLLACARAAGADAFVAGDDPAIEQTVAEIAGGANLWPQVALRRWEPPQETTYRAATMPTAAATLRQAATAIAEPSLRTAALLTRKDISTISELDALIRERRRREAAQQLPATERLRAELRWAATEHARRHGLEAEGVEAAAMRTLARLDDALVAVADALRDELYHPQARAALALSLLDPQDAWRIRGVAVGMRGELSWQGISATQLAEASSLPVGELRDLWREIDAHLIAHEHAALERA